MINEILSVLLIYMVMCAVYVVNIMVNKDAFQAGGAGMRERPPLVYIDIPPYVFQARF